MHLLPWSWLARFLTGGLHTQERMHRAGFECRGSALCVFCGEDIEDTDHIVWRCPRWRAPRALFDAIPADVLESWPAFTKLSGVFACAPDIIAAFNAQVLLKPPLALPRWVDWSGLDHDCSSYCDSDGRRWIQLATDGSCLDPEIPPLARCGAGLFIAPGHPGNVGLPVSGFPQSAQRAEVAAILIMLTVQWTDFHVFIDNKWVCDTLTELIGDASSLGTADSMAHFDLWRLISALLARSRFGVRATWIPGHTTQRDIDAGLITEDAHHLNAGADRLAGEGAAASGLASDVRAGYIVTLRRAEVFQDAVSRILQLRYCSLPLAHMRVGYSDDEIARRMPGGPLAAAAQPALV